MCGMDVKRWAMEKEIDQREETIAKLEADIKSWIDDRDRWIERYKTLQEGNAELKSLRETAFDEIKFLNTKLDEQFTAIRELEDMVKKYADALNAIKKHQELNISKVGVQLSMTWQIASKALSELPKDPIGDKSSPKDGESKAE